MTFGNDFRARALEKVSIPDTDYPTASALPPPEAVSLPEFGPGWAIPGPI
jgi:hypothetical protein